MRIVAAMHLPDEVDALIDAGADELYCGVVPKAWLKDLPGHDVFNRRNARHSSLHTLDDLQLASGRASSRGVPLSVALNAHAFEPALLPALVAFATDLAKAGARALIVSDPALLLALSTARVPLELHLSSVATCTNSAAASFFAGLGVGRVILPRYLSTRQIAAIIAAAPTLEYEAFALNDGCTYEEGLCLTLHHLGPFCRTPWQARPAFGADAPPALRDDWSPNFEAHQRLLWHLENCGGATSHRGWPNGPCGLCALPALAAAGVGHVKIAGRETPPERRLASVRLVKAVLSRMEAGEPAAAVAAAARALRDTPELCGNSYMCYYRE